MNWKPTPPPSFIKILVREDFPLRILVPPAFVRKWGKNLPRIAKLRISCGQIWDVELEKMEDMDYYFTRGWTKFSEDLGLQMGELLVFRFTGKATFDVSVYGISCCEREILATDAPIKVCDPDKADEFSKDYTCTNGRARVDNVGRTRNLNIKVKREKEDVIDPQDGCIQRVSRRLKQSNSHGLKIE